MKIKFWGTRGSAPDPSKSNVKYGGNTPCLQAFDDEGNFIIVDGGSCKLKVDNIAAHYSPGTLSFNFRLGTKTIAYLTDNEIHYDGKFGILDYNIIASQNKELVEFCSNCDYLVHDSMYTLKD